MHKLRSPAGRRGIGVHVVRIAAFSAALMAITSIVVADVTAAESEEPAMALLAADGWSAGVGADERGPVLLAAAVVVPDAVLAPAPSVLEELAPPVPPKKRKRRSKLELGRFEGY